MVYIFCFIWAPLFTYISEIQFNKGHKKWGILFGFLAILIPSLFAGLRAFDVGRDVNNYVTPVVRNSLSMGFIEYLKCPLYKGIYLEKGYSVLIYLCSHICKSANFSLFILQFLTMLFVYLYAYKNREKSNITFVIIIYMLTWYCISYTFMRQSLAIAIIIYSTTFFEEKEYLKTFLLYLLAISIHTISSISIIIYILIFISHSNINLYNKRLIYFTITLFLILGTLFFQQIVYFITNIVHILPSKYYDYAVYYTPDQTYSQLSDLTLKLFFIVCSLIYLCFANKKKYKIDISFIILLLFIDLASFLISYKIVNAGRVGFYFQYLGWFLLIPNINKAFKNIKYSRLVISSCLILFMFSIWIWKFPIRNWSETWPYRFYNSSNYFLVRK